MKIGVISDTHDRLPTFSRAINMFRKLKVEAIFHAGDFIAPFAAQLISPNAINIPVHCVYGNNDGQRENLKSILPQIVDGPLKIELAGKKIIMAHYIKSLKPADILQADVIISGYTHKVFNQIQNNKLFLNPGECCGWLNDVPTVAILDLENLKADIIQVHD